MIQKLILVIYIVFILSLNNVYSVFIKYKDLSSDNEQSYIEIVKQIKNDPNLRTYNNVRSFIGSKTLSSGALVDPYWFIKGFLYNTKKVEKQGSFQILNEEKIPQFDNKHLSSIKTNYYIVCPSPNSEIYPLIGMYHCYRENDQPILDYPIIPRATISDLKNTDHKFFALTRSVHQRNRTCIKNESLSEDDFYIIPCKLERTNSYKGEPINFIVDRVLEFKIDNTLFANLSFEFINTGAEETDNIMVLLTRSHELKLVGVTSSTQGQFVRAENIAHLLKSAFIDYILLRTALDGPPKVPAMNNK